MTTTGELLADAIDRLRASGSETARLDAELLLAHVLGVDRVTVVAHPEASVGPAAAERFADHVRRREAGEPVAYIRGLKEFHGLAFAVDSRVLIPRPETELLVDLALHQVVDRLVRAPRPPGTPPVTVADVGTGSGAVAIAMAVALRRRHMLDAVEIIASDLAEDCVAAARENAVSHAVADRVAVVQGDLLVAPGQAAGAFTVPARFDMVCANLPYIRSDVLATLAVGISFEPREALDGGPDGLDVMRRLLAQLPERLAPGGVALLEIGADQGGAIHAEAARVVPRLDVRVEPDLAGRPRVAVLTAPS